MAGYAILGIQIVGVLFALFMLYYCFLHYKRREFKAKELAMWIVLWLLFMVVALFPSVIDPLVSASDIARKMDFFIIAGFMFLITLTVYTHFLTKRMEKKIEGIVRKVAFDNPENETKKRQKKRKK